MSAGWGDPSLRLIKPIERDVACELTATDRGAISVIGVRGENLTGRLETYFSAASGIPLSLQAQDKPIYGLWNHEDVIVCLQDDDYAEVHCHGSVIACRRILDDLCKVGFAVKSWTDFEAENLSTAQQALRQLPKCPTLKTAAIMTRQSEGALDRAFVELETLQNAGKRDELLALISELQSFAAVGMHLTKPWSIAIVGAPNVGKSSLINRLIGFDRAIVFDQPGTTRDRVTVETAIDGWPIQLIDTAGIRETDDSVERSGVELARQAIGEADLVLEILDSMQPTPSVVTDDVSIRIRVLNKCDLLPAGELEKDSFEGVPVSALTGAGMEALLQRIANALIPNPPGKNQAVPFLAEHQHRLEEWKKQTLS